MHLFELSLADGRLRAMDGDIPKGKSRKWNEEIVQCLLVLNPELLAVSEHLPLRFDGSSTAVSPDQLYIDDAGRLVLVEVKSVKATLSAMAQLISYSEHWRVMPLGEMQSAFEAVRDSSQSELLSTALRRLTVWWRGAQAQEIGNPAEVWTWPETQDATIRDFALRCWGAHALAAPCAPARMVLIAPEFDEQCKAFAAELRLRHVAIELIRVDMLESGERVVLSWDDSPCPRSDGLEATWLAARTLLRIPRFVDEFALNGWAELLERRTLSFSFQKEPRVRLYLEPDSGMVRMYTIVPDRWASPKEARALKADLAVLPGVERQGRKFGWLFALPRQVAELTDRAQTLIDHLRRNFLKTPQLLRPGGGT